MMVSCLNEYCQQAAMMMCQQGIAVLLFLASASSGLAQGYVQQMQASAARNNPSARLPAPQRIARQSGGAPSTAVNQEAIERNSHASTYEEHLSQLMRSVPNEVRQRSVTLGEFSTIVSRIAGQLARFRFVIERRVTTIENPIQRCNTSKQVAREQPAWKCHRRSASRVSPWKSCCRYCFVC